MLVTLLWKPFYNLTSWINNGNTCCITILTAVSTISPPLSLTKLQMNSVLDVTNLNELPCDLEGQGPYSHLNEKPEVGTTLSRYPASPQGTIE